MPAPASPLVVGGLLLLPVLSSDARCWKPTNASKYSEAARRRSCGTSSSSAAVPWAPSLEKQILNIPRSPRGDGRETVGWRSGLTEMQCCSGSATMYQSC